MLNNNKGLLVSILVILGLVLAVLCLQMISSSHQPQAIKNSYEPQAIQPTLYTKEFPRELMLFDSKGQNFTVTKEGTQTVVQSKFNIDELSEIILAGYKTSLENNSWTIKTFDSKTNTIIADKDNYHATISLNKIPTGTEVNLKVTY